MNLALQRRRFIAVMAFTAVALVVALVAIVGALGFHIGWLFWVFAGAILAGFASHGWLMWGVLRDKAAPRAAP